MKRSANLLPRLLCMLFLVGCSEARKEKVMIPAIPFDFKDYADLDKQEPIPPSRIEDLVAYVSVHDSILYVADQDQLISFLNDNKLPSLQWSKGSTVASFVTLAGASTQLSVKIMAAAFILAAVKVPQQWDTQVVRTRRKVIPIEAFKTDCFNINMITPTGKTLLNYFRNVGERFTDFDYRGEAVNSGKVVQIKYELFGDPDPNGQLGTETYLFVQRYYGFTTSDCSAGLIESNYIQGKFVKNIVGHWPNP